MARTLIRLFVVRPGTVQPGSESAPPASEGWIPQVSEETCVYVQGTYFCRYKSKLDTYIYIYVYTHRYILGFVEYLFFYNLQNAGNNNLNK